MRIYEVYEPPHGLRWRLTIHDDGRDEWDVSPDELGGRWLDAEERQALLDAAAHFEEHRRPGMVQFTFRAYTVRPVPAP
jgi:hypothetical protein